MGRFELGLSTGVLTTEKIRAYTDGGIRWAETYFGPGRTISEMSEPYLAWRAGGGTDPAVWSVHAPFGKDWDIAALDPSEQDSVIGRWMQSFELAALLGAGVVVVHPGLELPLNTTHRDERLAACRAGLASLTDRARGRGIRIAVEALPRTCLGNTAEELAWLVQDCDPGITGFCLDVNHIQPTAKLAEAVRILAPRLITLHISDHDDIDERHWLPGEGVVDWSSLIAELRKMNYAGPFMNEVRLQWEDPESDVKSVLESYRALPW